MREPPGGGAALSSLRCGPLSAFLPRGAPEPSSLSQPQHQTSHEQPAPYAADPHPTATSLAVHWPFASLRVPAAEDPVAPRGDGNRDAAVVKKAPIVARRPRSHTNI